MRPYLPSPAEIESLADADAYAKGDVVARDEVSIRSLTYARLVRDVAHRLGAGFAAEIAGLAKDARRVHIAEAAFCVLDDELAGVDSPLSEFVDDVDDAVSALLAEYLGIVPLTAEARPSR